MSDARFFVAPNKPVSQMTDEELDAFAAALARRTKVLAAEAATSGGSEYRGESTADIDREAAES